MKSFEEIIKEKTDEELIIILCRSDEYQPKFIELVKKELSELRNIKTYSTFFKNKSKEELINYYYTSKNYPNIFIEYVVKELNERDMYFDLPSVYVKDEQTEHTDILGQTVPSVTTATALEQTDKEAIEQIYTFAKDLLFKEKQSKEDVINELINNGIDAENADIVVSNLLSAHNERANKDMLYGGLWFVGGIIATSASEQYLFLGAIVFGIIQFFRGLLRHT